MALSSSSGKSMFQISRHCTCADAPLALLRLSSLFDVGPSMPDSGLCSDISHISSLGKRWWSRRPFRDGKSVLQRSQTNAVGSSRLCCLTMCCLFHICQQGRLGNKSETENAPQLRKFGEISHGAAVMIPHVEPIRVPLSERTAQPEILLVTRRWLEPLHPERVGALIIRQTIVATSVTARDLALLPLTRVVHAAILSGGRRKAAGGSLRLVFAVYGLLSHDLSNIGKELMGELFET